MHVTDRRIKPARIGAQSSQAARRRALEGRRARFSNAVDVSRAAVADGEARDAGIDALTQQALRGIVEEVVRQEIEQKTARLDLRLEPQERATIEKAAKLSSRSLSEFVVHAAYQAALANIEREVVLRLSRRDSESLLAALDAPPEAQCRTAACSGPAPADRSSQSPNGKFGS